ncbi:MAG: hypothetical protein JWO33_1894, partial [Caulobacteraceae bacterium]|nr:hypothetical protein [Caulobacteraceae bacterium]
MSKATALRSLLVAGASAVALSAFATSAAAQAAGSN